MNIIMVTGISLAFLAALWSYVLLSQIALGVR